MAIITELYAFIAEDAGPEDEGIATFSAYNNNMILPMISGDIKHMKSLMPLAQAVSSSTGKVIRVFKFADREQVGILLP